MATLEQEAEINRDIPLLYDKIAQCHRAISDFERNIEIQNTNIFQYGEYIREDKILVKNGKVPRYSESHMYENIERMNKNIEMFNLSIFKERALILKTSDIIRTLQEDLKRPTEIVIDLRDKK